jgi:hypothetical protein
MGDRQRSPGTHRADTTQRRNERRVTRDEPAGAEESTGRGDDVDRREPDYDPPDPDDPQRSGT